VKQLTSAPRQGRWAAGGAVVSASVASACCWLPLLLVAFGASAAGVSAQLERFRPLLLGATAALLGAGFYFTYARRTTCAPGEACAATDRRMRRVNRVVLWLATVAAASFAAFPHYAGLLADTSGALTAESVELPRVELSLHGMTCEACAGHVVSALRDVPGVREAAVDYGSARATVALDPGGGTTLEELLRAVGRAGYEARPLRSVPPR
jgi:copper chaperone CopZ